MSKNTGTIDEYLAKLPEERKECVKRIIDLIEKNIPKGFEAQINYAMPGFVVPHTLYPEGYHCNPELPLPFINVASQKNSINLYHMGLYADRELHDWFVNEYPKHVKTKLDMGKSCIRFKKIDQIPYDLLSELVRKMSPQQWIDLYEKNFKLKSRSNN